MSSGSSIHGRKAWILASRRSETRALEPVACRKRRARADLEPALIQELLGSLIGQVHALPKPPQLLGPQKTPSRIALELPGMVLCPVNCSTVLALRL